MNLWRTKRTSPNAASASGRRGVGIALVLSLAIHVLLLRLVVSDVYQNVKARQNSFMLVGSIVRAREDSLGLLVLGNARSASRTQLSTSVGTQYPRKLVAQNKGDVESLSGAYSVPARPETPIDLRDIPAPNGRGLVGFTILVDENGIVRGADFDDKMAPTWFVDAILDRLRASRFIPAFSNGQSVPSVVKGIVEYQGEDGASTTNDNDR